MKLLSFVIVTWNCKPFLKECLESLTEFRHRHDVEFIIVDNASIDGTQEFVRSFYPDIVLIESSTNLGFPRGNNVGIKRCLGRYLCLVNPDVRVLPNCVNNMIRFMEENPRVGLLGPRMLDATKVSQRSYMGQPTLWNLSCRALALDSLFPRSKIFSGFLMHYFDRNQTLPVDILNGWFWLTRKEAVTQVGPMDETLFMYADDLDWSKRFKDAGWGVVYYAGAEAIHYGGGTTARAPIRFSVEMQRANFQYWQKNYGKLSQLLYRIIAALHQLVRIIGYSILFVTDRSRREDAKFKLQRAYACLQWATGTGHHGRLKSEAAIQPESTPHQLKSNSF
jgi:GT2 family glycosyltransferase